MATTLALHFGDTCGFAVGTRGYVCSGQFKLSEIWSRIDQLHGSAPVSRIVVTQSAASWRDITTTLAATCAGAAVLEFTNWEVRKQFAGDGRASRADVVAAARLLDFEPQGEPEAMALAAFDFALGLPPSIAEAA